jgi:hypothetical protein
LTVKYWTKLSTYEKTIILNLIDSSRNDVQWIKAMLLLEDEIPKEIEIKIVGNINLYSLKPVKVLEILSDELIHNCLQIIYVKPYELEYLRSIPPSNFWKKIINHILFFEVKPHFELCIKGFIGHNIYGNRSENFLLWRKICLHSKNIDYLTYIVIYNISKSSIYINGTTEMIKNLIFAYKKRNEYEVFLKIISEEIEVMQLDYDKNEIFDYLGKEFIFNDLYKMLLPDLTAKLIIEKAGIEYLSDIIDDIKSFRFFASYLVIENLVNKSGKIDVETKKKLLSIPNNIEKIGKEKQKKLKSKYFKEEKIQNWTN